MASFLRTTMLNRAQDNIAKRLRSKLFGAVLIERDMEWFVSGESSGTNAKSENDESSQVVKVEKSTAFTPGAIGTILTEDINKASESITVTFANVLRSCSSCAFATYHMLSINPTLFGISVSVVPVVGAAAVILNKFVKRATAKQRECAERAASFAEERICHIETVKLANREKSEVEEYIMLQEECVVLGRKVSSAKGSFMGFMFAATGGALYMVFNAGGRDIAAGRMTSGELTSFATYSFLLGLGTSGVFKALGEASQGLVCADRVYKLMDVDAEHAGKVTSDKSESVDAEAVQSILLDKICFSYKSLPDTTVLKDVSMDLQRGKVVALVGKNGSGKTSLASVIAGLYTPQTGKMTVLPSGQSFHELDRQSQTALVQVVPQHPALFDTSIRNNLVYSCPDASEASIERALKLANCDDFISKLEGELEFGVGRNGMRLSGGQRQRLALARALLSDPCLLILDGKSCEIRSLSCRYFVVLLTLLLYEIEPTSALDSEGEEAVMDAVHACRSGDHGATRGLLLITHRASTLKVADLIVVLKDGKVVAEGTYEELTRRKDSELCELMAELA
jgi:ABC-type multidrug transport system fused ATPase/permease subunit